MIGIPPALEVVGSHVASPCNRSQQRIYSSLFIKDSGKPDALLGSVWRGFDPEKGIRLLGVTLSSLEHSVARQAEQLQLTP